MPIYEYPVTVNWEGGRGGSGSVLAERSGTLIDLKVPEEFQGPGGATNPEELFACALAGCYTITFGIIATNRKLPVTHIETRATGLVEQCGATFNYKSITMVPVITVSAEATDAQIMATHDMALKTDPYCIIGNAARDKVNISIEPRVERASSGTKAC